MDNNHIHSIIEQESTNPSSCEESKVFREDPTFGTSESFGVSSLTEQSDEVNDDRECLGFNSFQIIEQIG